MVVDNDNGTEDKAFTLDQQDIIKKLIEKTVTEATTVLQSNLDGVNRKNSELQKELATAAERKAALEKEKLSADERYKLDMEQREADIKKGERALIEKTNKEAALKFAAEHKIPLDLIDLVPVSDEAAMLVHLNKLKAVVDSDRASVLDAIKKDGGVVPKAGGSGGNVAKKKKSELTLSEAMEYARKNGQDKYNALPE